MKYLQNKLQSILDQFTLTGERSNTLEEISVLLEELGLNWTGENLAYHYDGTIYSGYAKVLDKSTHKATIELEASGKRFEVPMSRLWTPEAFENIVFFESQKVNIGIENQSFREAINEILPKLDNDWGVRIIANKSNQIDFSKFFESKRVAFKAATEQSPSQLIVARLNESQEVKTYNAWMLYPSEMLEILC